MTTRSPHGSTPNPLFPDAGLSRASALLADASGRQRWRFWPWRLPKAAPQALPAEVGRCLQFLVQASQAHLVLSFGTAQGQAAVWLADALRTVPGGRSDRALIGFERDAETARTTRDVLRRAGVSRYVDIRCDAPLRALAMIDTPIDLVVLLDEPPALALLDSLLPKLRSGGSLVVRQIDRRRTLAEAVAAHAGEGGSLQCLRLPIDGGLLWAIKS